MKKEIVERLFKDFEDYVHVENGIEFWYARDLQKLLGYVEWRKFLGVVEKAKETCKNAGNVIIYHFVGAAKMVRLGSDAERKIEDIMLTRYACYLIAQNGDPRKEQIAFAQTYFAIQTRKQEILEKRLELSERLHAREKLVATETELSKIIYERGVDSAGFARIRSKGDRALFGGHTTIDMKSKLKIPVNRPLADFLPTITIKAKDLATEITNFNVKKDDMHGESPITGEHVKNNQDVRALLAKSGIKPESLPPEEDIRKLERRLKSDDKNQLGDVKKLKK